MRAEKAGRCVRGESIMCCHQLGAGSDHGKRRWRKRPDADLDSRKCPVVQTGGALPSEPHSSFQTTESNLLLMPEVELNVWVQFLSIHSEPQGCWSLSQPMKVGIALKRSRRRPYEEKTMF